MDVECTLHGNGFKIPDNTEGNRVLVIKNDTGYHNVNISIKEFFDIDNTWHMIGHISVDGCSLIKAINNAMND